MNKKSKGAISSTLLILGVVLLVVIVIVFVVIKVNQAKTADKGKDNTTNTNQPAVPVYETQLGDVKFTFISATDMGRILKSKDPRYSPDLTTNEKFIKVVIGAQNKGKINVKRDVWFIGNLVDSEGRNFIPVNDGNQNYSFQASSFNSNTCGALLKPEFSPIPCEKYYEVSRASTGFKVQVGVASETSAKKQEGLIDLIVK